MVYDIWAENRIFQPRIGFKKILKRLKACLVGVFWVFQSIFFSIVRHLGREPDFWAENLIFKKFLKSLKTCLVIGIDHDTVCAVVVGTAIRNSTSCAGRRAAACGRAGRHNECCSGLQYQPRQRRPYKWSISILPRSQFTKSKGNLRFRRLVPLFVPIGVCVTTHDDGTASDVTIAMWRHNQQVTNHERNGKPWFSLPK